MSETQLALYNDALLLCEERQLASLAENRKPRRLLDFVWNNGGVRACLEEGFWTFATRTTAIQYDPNIQPAYGYIHAFKKPDDYIRTAALSSEPYFQAALTQIADEADYWWGDLATLYIKYISSDQMYGFNLPNWSESFKNFASAYFAFKIVKSLTRNQRIQENVEKAYVELREGARGKDSMNEPTQFFPRGQLSRARQGMYFGRPNRTGNGWY